MLIHDFVQVEASLEAVCGRLLGVHRTWIADDASSAYADGERLCGQVQPGARSAPAAGRVHVDLGRSYRRGDGWVMPIHWWATRPARLFPTLDADLEIMPLGPGVVMLTLMGHYDPPSGNGHNLDRVLLHRVAEASVRGFLRRLESELCGAGSRA